MKFLWTPWAGYGVAVLALLLLLLPRPSTTKKTYHENETTHAATASHITVKEGSTTTIKPDGTTVISGPADIRTEAESSSSKSVDSTTTSSYAQARWSAGGVALLPALSLRPAYGASIGYRLLGPVWVEGLVVVREALPDVGVVVRVTF